MLEYWARFPHAELVEGPTSEVKYLSSNVAPYVAGLYFVMISVVIICTEVVHNYRSLEGSSDINE